MQMDIIDQTNQVAENDLIMLENLLIFIAEKENIHQDSEVAITIVNDQTIKQLNNEYRNKNKVTDVLSFPLEENLNIQLPVHLGDIVICLERAMEQAKEYNHTFQRELGFLAAHGVLHLLGYDHQDQVSEAEMFNKQKALLDAFGLTRD